MPPMFSWLALVSVISSSLSSPAGEKRASASSMPCSDPEVDVRVSGSPLPLTICPPMTNTRARIICFEICPILLVSNSNRRTLLYFIPPSHATNAPVFGESERYLSRRKAVILKVDYEEEDKLTIPTPCLKTYIRRSSSYPLHTRLVMTSFGELLSRPKVASRNVLIINCLLVLDSQTGTRRILVYGRGFRRKKNIPYWVACEVGLSMFGFMHITECYVLLIMTW